MALRRANGLTRIASHDANFDRVPGLTRYAPLTADAQAGRRGVSP